MPTIYNDHMNIFFWRLTMAAKFAPTSISTKPDDSVVTVDVYGTPPQQPTNNLGSSSNIGFDVSDGIFGGKQLGGGSVAGLFKQMAKNYAETGKLDPTDQLGKVVSSAGIKKTNLIGAGGVVANSILQGFGLYKSPLSVTVDGIIKSAGGDSLEKTLLGGYDKINLVVKNIKADADDLKGTFNKLKDLKTLTDLSNIIANISGDNDFLKIGEIGSVLQVMKGINSVAKEFSIPGVIDKLITRFQDDDKKSILIGAASDNNALYDINYVETLGANFNTTTILTQNPILIKEFLARFTPSIENPTTSLELTNRLIAALEGIDPNWDKIKRGNEYVTDLSVFKACGTFARRCFLFAELYKTELAICDFYSDVPMVTLAKQLYPYLGLTVNNDTIA